ncbi:DUF4625 domain-containing protein [Segetibacter sp. 3557_3]|uniref:DUF4625 domain-containing protein n=1 Tax=Segetibacter sp. 3557_3 TaxID=2547429 RepID=UPI001058EAF2|nr:DUF4625 domain-containing protein [Segetibacter sp. 3557_3]TDH26961.1 DUF4625 domain-containing protein [Segetibacter sp. 3557_3]
MVTENLLRKNSDSARWALIIFIVSCGFVACKKESANVAMPILSNLEVGTNNNKIAYPGHDFHLEASIVASGSLASIKLQITPVLSGRGWSYTKIYTTGYAGLKNTTFHEHLDVPADAVVGDYDVLLLVTDQLGNKSEVTGRFKVVNDPTLPSITGLQLTLNPNGDALKLTGVINAPGRIAKLDVRVQSTAWTKVFSFTDADMVGYTTHNLNRSIDLSDAPKGHYHIHFTLSDQVGKQIGYEYHFDKN